MSNKLILDLTFRLTQALDQNYDVVNMDTVLAVISELEGATITKEQLETTRLARHINQLRRRIKNNIIAIRAKNLLKKWREMVGITSQAQSEVTSSLLQMENTTNQQVPKPSSSSQPASPYTTQLLVENFDNSLSSAGGGVELSRTATGCVSNSGSTNCITSKKLVVGTVDEGGVKSSRSNGASSDVRLIKKNNRNITQNSSPEISAQTITVKHPTSFKNLITGFNVSNSCPNESTTSPLSPVLRVPSSSGGLISEREAYNSKTYVIDDHDNKIEKSSPRNHKWTKRKERKLSSPDVMTFLEHSHSPLGFENHLQEQGKVAEPVRKTNQFITSTIDLQDSDSSSNFDKALCNVTDTVKTERDGIESNTEKNIRKEKKRSNEKIEMVTESEHFQPTIDESSRIAFPISGIQEYLSLSNSSMSIFPSQQTVGSEKGGYQINTNSNAGNQPMNSSLERSSDMLDKDLTFAGKFKQSNSSSGIEHGSGLTYFTNGGENITVISVEFPSENIKTTINNSRDSVSVGGTGSTSVFLPYSRNSNDSSSNSRISQVDLIDVVNQDSQSMIIIDDLRQRQQTSDYKSNSFKNIQSSQQSKYIKDVASKQYLREQTKLATTVQRVNVPGIPFTSTSATSVIPLTTTTAMQIEQKIPKKRGRKKGSKGVDAVLSQSSGLSSQFLMGPALGSNKKVKTTIELLADIQNRKIGSATSSPILMNWFGTSRPTSSCSEPSLQSPSDACSTNATISTAARSTPEKTISNNSIAADEYGTDSDTNASAPSRDSLKITQTCANARSSLLKSTGNDDGTETILSMSISSIEEQINEIMAMLPPIDTTNINWEAYENVPCTCALREIPPQLEIKSDQNEKKYLDLLKNADDIKKEDNLDKDDVPIISVSVFSRTPQQKLFIDQQRSLKTPILKPELVSTVTSPIVPSATQKTVKSIFDLDFDDDNDPLHTYMEVASKTINSTNKLTNMNGRILHDSEAVRLEKTKSNVFSNSFQYKPLESEQVADLYSSESITTQLPEVDHENSKTPNLLLLSFPTYEVIEDPYCVAKQRYEIQPNQITTFHVNAFHNCYIPNVNGNWDHSLAINICNNRLHEKNDSLYANVVPKYGSLYNETIPKDLSHVKLTKRNKLKTTNKSDKPPSPFLGVANIHQRQSLHGKHGKIRKKNLRIRRKQSKQNQQKSGKNNIKINDENEHIKTDLFKNDLTEASKQNEVRIKQTHIDEDINIIDHPKGMNSLQASYIGRHLSSNNTGELIDSNILKKESNSYKNFENKSSDFNGKEAIKSDPELIDAHAQKLMLNRTDLKKTISNGNIQHLMNNNSIVHCTDAINNVISKKHSIAKRGTNIKNVHDMSASRRSSSCSNSSLKQNQNSINMKLRRHRLKQRQLKKERQNRKRKHLSLLSDVGYEFGPDESREHAKVHSQRKKINIVNGDFKPLKRLTNSITDSICMEDDGDSDCYQLNSEQDMITEEEIDEDGTENANPEGDEDGDFEDIADVYDEDDVNEDYRDFHEVVTRDMTSSTTGNNHIVLTIKKTPSKTSSPSSSSVSPAPVQYTNNKLSSLYPTIKTTEGVLVIENNAFEVNIDRAQSDQHEESKINSENLLELGTVKADLINKTDFFLQEPSDVTLYSFHLKKNGDNDHGKDESEYSRNDKHDANEIPNEDEEPKTNKIQEIKKKSQKFEDSINKNNLDKKRHKNCITKTELCESIQLTQKHLIRRDLKNRLKQGIENAKKLHRKLFFPYELNTLIGSKMFELSSCTSDCTDPTDNDTDINDNETSIFSSSSDDNGIKSRILLKRQRGTKRTAKKRKAKGCGGGAGDPSSSSSSSSSSTSSSSTETFASWTLSSSDENSNKSFKIKIEEEEALSKKELPFENNFLLKSFNHIYVSTEERQRQQQLKYGNENYRQDIINTGYITLNGDINEEAPVSLVGSDNCDLYINYYNYSYSHKNTSKPSIDNTSSPKPSAMLTIQQPSITQSPPSGKETLITSSVQSLTDKISSDRAFSMSATNLEKSSQNNTEGFETSNRNDDKSVQVNVEQNSQEWIAAEEYRTGKRKVDEDVDDEDGNNCARTQQFKEWHEVLQLRSYNDELLTVLPYVVIE